MRRSVMFLIVSSLAMATPSLAQVAAVCSPLLSDGVFERSELQTEWNNYRRMSSLFCSSEASTLQKARDLGASASIPIEGIIANFGFNNNETGYQQFRKNLCYSGDQMASSRGWLNEVVARASTAILSAYNDCVGAMKGGFTQIIELSDRNSPDFSWKFINSVPAEKNVFEVTLSIPGDVSCYDGKNAVKSGRKFKIGANPLSLSCKRSVCSSSLLVVASSTYAITPSSIRLPEYNDPPGPPPVEYYYRDGPWHPMNGTFYGVIPDAPPNAICRTHAAKGGWSCHGYSCPLPCFSREEPRAPRLEISGNTYFSGRFDKDGEYHDNYGNCQFTFECHNPVVFSPGPALPEWCRMPRTIEKKIRLEDL